jgi:septal ring factor EnvC (AmiA/AmiB activator)
MSVRPPSFAILLAALFLLTAAVYPRQDIPEIEKRISQLNDQIKGLKAKIQAENKKESSILSNLSRIGLTKRLIRSEMAANDALLEKTNGE